ncbi:MAG TPA: hypothetical protein VIP11_17720 [Gemmatimonadaceae bacterium]
MRSLAGARVAVLAASTVVGLSSGSAAVANGNAIAATKCEASIATYEQRWGGRSEWRVLPPYPVERDASPTDSIGVWLERSRTADGTLELRRVSVDETIIAHASGATCDVQLTHHRRTYDRKAMARAFGDEQLRALVRDTPAGVVYVWSPRMPLSVLGVAEAKAAAAELGVAFTAIVAEASPDELRDADSLITRSMSSLELVYRNATIHYPSIIFYRDGRLLGSGVPGFKRRETYVALARDAFAGEKIEHTSSIPTLWVDHKAQVKTTRTVQTIRSVGFFFKPVAGTDFVSYTSKDAAFLFHLGERREQRIPGNVDPVPTPDGRLLTRPGLLFYPMRSLIAGDDTPAFKDSELPDEYQTASILKRTKDVTRYRVVTGWRMGARLRDYDVTFDRDGKPVRFQPLGEPTVPCPDRQFSLPISAKASKEIGVYDKRTLSNHVIEVTDDGGCVDVLDLGFASGKLSFSYDGTRIAFATSRINTDADGNFLKPEETFYKDALVLYRKTGRIVSLSANRPLSGMTFPEFLPDGRIMILDQASRMRTTEVFRVVEVK